MADFESIESIWSSKVDDFHNRGFTMLVDAIDPSIIDQLRIQTMSNYEDCMAIIAQKDHELGVGIKNGFKEIVQRHTGRFEMPHRMEELDCSFLEVEDSPVRRVVTGILGEGYIVANRSAVISLPGAGDQAWHCDGPHMSAKEHLPAHVLNVFIPLIPMTRELGATEFRPESHVITRDTTKLLLAAVIKRQLKPLEAPLAPPGGCVLFDYRTLHRGLANTTDTIRPMLVYTFAKPWYKDVLNFPKYSIYDEKREKVVEEGSVEER